MGAAEVFQVTELAEWPFALDEMFPEAAEAGLDGSAGLVLAIHAYVIRIGGRAIVVDTANGNDKQRPNLLPHHLFSTDFLRQFAGTGVRPDEVDLVVNTHLHPDHCGWNTWLDGDVWRPTFAAATHLFAASELAWIEQLKAQHDLDGVAADLGRMYDDSVRPVLDTGRWELVDDEQVIAQHDGTTVTVRMAPGHTTGHLVVEIRHPSGGAVMSGDLIHHPVQLAHPDLCQGGDADPRVARASREALLQRCVDENLLLMPSHFAEDAPLRVDLDQQGHAQVTPLDPTQLGR